MSFNPQFVSSLISPNFTMSSDNASPQAVNYSNNDQSTEPRTLPGHNPALARYNQLQLRQEAVVRPDLFTLYFGFLGSGNWRRKVATAVTDRVENHYVLTARSPTQSELDAIVEHGTRSLYHNRIGMPVGSIIGGAWVYARLRSSPGFPRKNPTPQAILEAMRLASSGVSLKSFAAAAAWRMLFTTCFVSALSNIYAVYNDATSMLTDPRLKSFVQEMRSQKPEDVRKRKLQAASERVRSMRSGEKTIGSEFNQAMTQPGYTSSYEQDPNDYSTPPNSYSEYEGSNSTSTQSTYTSTPEPSNSTGPVWARGRGQPAEQTSGTDFFDDDDASPTAAEYRNTNIDGSSGSAWDRIRRQNGAAGSRQQLPQSTLHPYSYENSHSEQDSHGQLSEKDKAQAEFDRMIDAERNAGSDKSRNRGWGS
ncbi:unnamed protein product [Penicillium salamii]|uniref:Endo-1,3(4)-beta-glucanase n=1 Tax=Penicillium salamii TaxID=1612424 RepID=A0A9W4NBB8_9EURO|nr:unnamed protein product [Penicillium salamii]CAG8000710.1 unnamed protein product [Penicillium salamii]CAG8047183.1 unnamed protein product [Penicillium salamii]CAG8064945.1 unnamed protein product [Penicillium salamii]CAG8226241.1 unnamed protein product [Penicillium salamii]